MFEIKWVTKLYPISKKERIIALHNLSISFPNEGMVFFIGPEKSGKTTLFHLLGGLDKPSFGDILYDGDPVGYSKKGEKSKELIAQVSSIFEDHNVNRLQTVNQRVKASLHDKEEMHDIKKQSLEEANINHQSIGQFISRIDGQKASLAAAIAKDSKVILVDEPSLEIMDTLKKRSTDRLVIVFTKYQSLVDQYADRVIELSFGKVISDQVLKPKEKDQKQESIAYQHEETLNIRKIPWFQWLKRTAMVLLLIISLAYAISFVSSFIALRDFDLHETMAHTMEQNESYIVPVQRYEERAYTYGWPFIVRAGTHPVDEVSKDDILGIKGKTGNLIPVYPAYYFNKSLRDFFDFEYEDLNNDYNPYFDSIHFTEIIVVDDYVKFNEPLKYGSLPDQDDEILIYDYMADQLLQHGLVSAQNEQDLIDTVLIDRDTNFSMRISGILKSAYEKYDYSGEGSPFYNSIEQVYLGELQVIYGSSELLDLIIDENQAFSIMDAQLLTNLMTETSVQTDFRKAHIVETIDAYTFIGDVSPYFRNPHGVLLSKHQLADLLNVDVSVITPSYVNDLNLYEDFYLTMDMFHYDYLQRKPGYLETGVAIYGIYDSSTLEEHDVDIYFPEDRPFQINGELRRLYLSLSDNWDLNTDILRAFEWPEDKAVAFFYENVGFLNEDIGVYAVDRLIASRTQSYINDYGLRYALISAGLIINMFIVSYALTRVSIRWDYDNILVHRSMGRSDRLLSGFYMIKVFIIMMISVVLSIFLIRYLLSVINQSGLDYNQLVYFNLTYRSMYLWISAAIIIPLILCFTGWMRLRHLKKLSKLHIKK